MACAKSYQLPLCVQGQGCDHSRRLALDQSKGLEAGREQYWVFSHIQSSVTLINNRTTNHTALVMRLELDGYVYNNDTRDATGE